MSQRLPDRRVILVEVVGNLAQVVARGRLGGQSQGDSRRQHCLERLIESRLSDLDRLAPLVEVLLADASTRREVLAPPKVVPRQLQSRLPALQGRDVGPQVGDLGVDVLDGALELEPIGLKLGYQTARLRLGGRQVRLGRRHGGLLEFDLILEGFLVELDQHVPLLHPVVVIDQHPAHLA